MAGGSGKERRLTKVLVFYAFMYFVCVCAGVPTSGAKLWSRGPGPCHRISGRRLLPQRVYRLHRHSHTAQIGNFMALLSNLSQRNPLRQRTPHKQLTAQRLDILQHTDATLHRHSTAHRHTSQTSYSTQTHITDILQHTYMLAIFSTDMNTILTCIDFPKCKLWNVLEK